MRSYGERCGGRGCRVFAGRIRPPVIWWNLRRRRNRSYYLGHIERPLVSILNLCIRWGGDRRYPITTGDYPFERKIFPPVSSTKEDHRSAFQGLREVSTTSYATHPGQDKNCCGCASGTRCLSQFESSMGGYGNLGRKFVSD